MSAPPRTLTELFFDAVQAYGAHPAAFRHKADGAWRDVSHREAATRVQALSLGLRELGLAAGEKVAILAETRVEWALIDYACLCARATDVPIYPTLPANQVEYILRDAGAAAVVCSTAAQVEKIRAVKSGLPSLRHVIVFDGRGATGWSPSPSWRRGAGRPPPSIPGSRRRRSACGPPTSRPCCTRRGRRDSPRA